LQHDPWWREACWCRSRWHGGLLLACWFRACAASELGSSGSRWSTRPSTCAPGQVKRHVWKIWKNHTCVLWDAICTYIFWL
jgi:hypothetical protein